MPTEYVDTAIDEILRRFWTDPRLGTDLIRQDKHTLTPKGVMDTWSVDVLAMFDHGHSGRHFLVKMIQRGTTKDVAEVVRLYFLSPGLGFCQLVHDYGRVPYGLPLADVGNRVEAWLASMKLLR